jgi:hypothetical protein
MKNKQFPQIKKCINQNLKNTVVISNKNLKVKSINKKQFRITGQHLKVNKDQNTQIHLLMQPQTKTKIDLCKLLILITKEIVFLKNKNIKNKITENATDKGLKVV